MIYQVNRTRTVKDTFYIDATNEKEAEYLVSNWLQDTLSEDHKSTNEYNTRQFNDNCDRIVYKNNKKTYTIRLNRQLIDEHVIFAENEEEAVCIANKLIREGNLSPNGEISFEETPIGLYEGLNFVSELEPWNDEE